jgi:hypothetical protein
MAGLLDSLTAALGGEGLDTNGKAALNQGLLTMGLSMLASPGKFGQQLGNSGLAGMQAYQGAQQQQRRNAFQDMQMQQVQMQMDADKRKEEQEASQRAWRQNLPSPQLQASQQALAGGGGPTPQNAARMTAVDPVFQQIYEAVRAGVLPYQSLIQAQQKDNAPLVVPQGGSVYRGGQMVAHNAKDPRDDAPAEWKLYNLSGAAQKGLSFDDWNRANKQAGAQAINVGVQAPFPDKDGNVWLPPKTAGGLATPLMKPGGGGQVAAQGKTPPVEFTKSIAGLKELENGLASYEATLKQQGGPNALAMRDKRAALQGSFTALQMGLKNAFELGALAGPDLDLLNSMLSDPTSMKAQALGSGGVAQQIAKAREYLANRRKAVYEAHQQPVPADAAPPSTPRKVKFLGFEGQ